MKSLQQHLNENLLTENMILTDGFVTALINAIEPKVDNYLNDLIKSAKDKGFIKKLVDEIKKNWKELYKEKLLNETGVNDGKTIGHSLKRLDFYLKFEDFSIDDFDAALKDKVYGLIEDINFDYGILKDVVVRIYGTRGICSLGITIKEYKPNKNAKLEASGGTGKLNSGLFDLFNTPISVGDICICSNVKSHGALVYGKVTNVGASKVSIVSLDGEKCIAEPKNCVILQTVDGKVIDPKKVQIR